MSKKSLTPSLKNEYFNVYESNLKERAHINRAPPLVCRSSWNWTKKEIFAKLLVYLVQILCDLLLVLGKKALAILLEVGSSLMVSLVNA